MTPRQRAEMERLKGRNRLLEQRNRELVAETGGRLPRRPRPRRVSKIALDRLIWLTLAIEDKPKGQRFVPVPLSASDGKLFRRLFEQLRALNVDKEGGR